MTTSGLYERLEEAADALRQQIGERHPTVGLILGSGLGAFADTFDDRVAVDYADIPYHPTSTVDGHAGRLVFGRLVFDAGPALPCVAMQGRMHYYEGYDLATVTFGARLLVHLGARTLVITNAAGGIGTDLRVGDLMLIRDHLNLFGADPLRGPNDERLGPRFPDMTHAYDAELRARARAAVAVAGIELREGVYAGLHGPSYETPAEIEQLRRAGADAVGMSTVPEVIVANHMGARVLGISCITNLAAGTTGEKLDHGEVTDVTRRVEKTFASVLRAVLADLAT